MLLLTQIKQRCAFQPSDTLPGRSVRGLKRTVIEHWQILRRAMCITPGHGRHRPASLYSHRGAR